MGKKLNLTDFHKHIFSLSSGLIFLTVPSHTEAVSWIAGRTDVVSTFFCLFSFTLYLTYKNYNKKYWLIISLFLFFTALCSKECVIFYPVIIFSYELYLNFSRKNIYKILSITFLYGFLFALYMIIRYIQLGTFIGGYGNKVHLKFIPGEIFQNIISYPVRSLLPPLYHSIPAIGFAGIFFIIIFIYSCLFLSKNKELRGISIFLISCALISLLPVINLGISHRDTQGQRFLYLPSSFTSLYIAFLLASIRSNKKVVITLLLSLLLIFTSFLYSTNQNWVQASQIGKNILTSLEQFNRSERLFITGLPDNFNGAYIYRNGFHNAIKLFKSELKIDNINIVLFNTTYNIKEETLIEPLQEPHSYKISLTGKKSYFMNSNIPLEETFSNQYYDVLDFKDNSYILKFKEFTSNDKLAAYSTGKLVNASCLY
jgi:hypothetical protein